jgi:hypothetical protein
MQMIEKGKLLSAMKMILREYKKNEHEAAVTRCKLCLLYNRYRKEYKKHECELCPMYVFYDTDCIYYPCMKRYCEPIDCYYATEDTNDLKAVIEFYKRAIKKVDSMTSEELNKRNAFKFLIKMDEEVAKEFCLV